MNKLYSVSIIAFLLLFPAKEVVPKIQDSVIEKKDIVVEEVHDTFSYKITDNTELINGTMRGFVYFSRDTCPVCLWFNSFLEEECSKNPNLVIYKYDTDYWRDDEDFGKIITKYNIQKVPTLIRINSSESYEVFVSEKDKVYESLKKFLYE